jgi:hypothetical protein
MHCQIQNTSAFHQLRIYQQDRVRNPYTPGLVPRNVVLTTRSDFEELGTRTVMVKSSGTARGADGVLRSVVRDVPTPYFRTVGFESLPEFVTENMEKQLRESQQAPATAPKGQKVVDEWGAIHPLQSVPAGGKVVLPISEERRLLVECLEDEVGLQIANESNTRTLRLRNRDAKTGEVEHIAWIPPAREWPTSALVICNGSKSAVIELTPA